LASTLFGFLVLVFQEQAVTGEMWARCRPSPLDFCVGMVGGIAASYARTRQHLSSALAGAAIAAALVPPISTAGLQIAFQAWTWEETDKGVPIVGPLLLVAVNVLMIMIGSSFVLWARGMRSDRSLSIKDRWTLRMFALLMMLALLILIWVLHPFPEKQLINRHRARTSQHAGQVVANSGGSSFRLEVDERFRNIQARWTLAMSWFDVQRAPESHLIRRDFQVIGTAGPKTAVFDADFDNEQESRTHCPLVAINGRNRLPGG
jgi:hypothetical protein